MDRELEGEFQAEFNSSWDRYRIEPKCFRILPDFSSERRVNIIETNDDNATIEELDESGETVRSVVPLSSLSNFRR